MVKAMSFFVKGLYFPKPQMKMSTKVNFLFGGFLFSSHLTTTIPASITCFNFLQAFLGRKGRTLFFKVQFFGNSICIFLPTKKYYSFLTFVMFAFQHSSANWLLMQIEFVIHHSTWFKFYSRQVLLGSIIIISPANIFSKWIPQNTIGRSSMTCI